MEENMADLDRMYKNDVQKIYDTYNTQKSIFTCAAHEEIFPFNPVNTPSLFYYGPLNYYFAGQFDKAFEFIDKRIEIAKGSEARIFECMVLLTMRILKIAEPMKPFARISSNG